ncbi:MAG: bifunctional 4-hydroxy-2-oxoglutarate aldolase/2-dehydro-3-deoxy-phosphogluconate aldolase [Bacteroidales bacterium]|jgi:2-dehydro-3-deoxyphosphogluconate aldolase/(4S)-4-hydroxy-2-oxoglutarate aldolase|nr:bifunctional 4-hydroxy-2-oxoglutarate aldolase/2-dehydro-3-deoxy-phosphogluconate aldolase [Bacteroidales bacterium]
MARFTRIQVATKMAESGMIPVFFNRDVETCKKVLEASYKGGIRLFEFTNRGDYAHTVFEELNRFAEKEFPEMILGTGSVIDAPTAVLYMQLGSNFIVSPLLNEEMAYVCNRRKVLWSPGCGSASEISKAEMLGAEIVKIFPGAQVGGPKFVAAVKGPMPWTQIMPTGGVDPSEANLTEWFKAGVICCGMGSQLIKSDLIKAGNYKQIEEDIKTAIELAKRLRAQYPVKL